MSSKRRRLSCESFRRDLRIRLPGRVHPCSDFLRLSFGKRCRIFWMSAILLATAISRNLGKPGFFSSKELSRTHIFSLSAARSMGAFSSRMLFRISNSRLGTSGTFGQRVPFCAFPLASRRKYDGLDCGGVCGIHCVDRHADVGGIRHGFLIRRCVPA